MKRITENPITTICGLVVGAFTLAALWFQKVDYTTTLLLTSVSVGLILGKDTIFTKFLKK